MDRKDSLSVIILKGILSVGILHATVDYVRVIFKFSLYLWWLCCPLLLVAGCRLAGAALLGGRLFLGCCSACREAVGRCCSAWSKLSLGLCRAAASLLLFGRLGGVRGLAGLWGSFCGAGALDSPGWGFSTHRGGGSRLTGAGAELPLTL